MIEKVNITDANVVELIREKLPAATEATGCWYISTPGFKGVCPVGLFVKV